MQDERRTVVEKLIDDLLHLGFRRHGLIEWGRSEQECEPSEHDPRTCHLSENISFGSL